MNDLILHWLYVWATASHFHRLMVVALAQYLPWLVVISMLVVAGYALARGRGKSVSAWLVPALCSGVLAMLVATVIQSM